jgi:hypothetical protein
VLYYGDRAREVEPRAALTRLRARLELAPPRDLLVEAGELAQGLADHAFALRGCDDPDPAADLAVALTRALAGRAWETWSGAPAVRAGPAPPAHPGAARDGNRPAPLLDALMALPLPSRVRVVEPEGYAHYALYPETYGEAARGLGGGALTVVGLRSIGTSLAAIVAAAAGASGLVTVRPAGHPFARELRLGAALSAWLRAAVARGGRFAVVDEGPGLSGSSFGAVAAWLEAAGADASRIVLFPSHPNPPGPAATPQARARWDGAERRLVAFEDAVLPRLVRAASAALGCGELADVSGGGWRAHARGAGDAPLFRQGERRKYLARGGAGPVLLSFAGLGARGERARERAAALADAGFSPPLATGHLVEGFLARRWADGVALPGAPVARGALLARLADYLAFRARTFPAERGDGASPERLLEMVRVNAAEALGVEAAGAAARLEEGCREAERLAPVAVDGKLEPWEWLVTPGGALLKVDAVDHAAAHDLAGAQPLAWDVAGAIQELELDPREAASLARRVAPEAGPAARALHAAAYAAHRVGRWTFAFQTEADPAERARVERALARARGALARALGLGASPR